MPWFGAINICRARGSSAGAKALPRAKLARSRREAWDGLKWGGRVVWREEGGMRECEAFAGRIWAGFPSKEKPLSIGKMARRSKAREREAGKALTTI